MIENIKINCWVVMAAFFSTLTIIITKYYVNNGNLSLLLVALVSEACLIYCYIQTLYKKDIVTEFALVKILAILFVIIPSMIFFNTKLTSKIILGLFFACIAIYLLH